MAGKLYPVQISNWLENKYPVQISGWLEKCTLYSFLVSCNGIRARVGAGSLALVLLVEEGLYLLKALANCRARAGAPLDCAFSAGPARRRRPAGRALQRLHGGRARDVQPRDVDRGGAGGWAGVSVWDLTGVYKRVAVGLFIVWDGMY